MKVNEYWKELRPQIGAFVSMLDGLYKGAENIDEALAKAEFKGYQRGYEEDKRNKCQACGIKDFYQKCNGSYDIIEKYIALSNSSKLSIKTMILQLYHLEQERGTNER